MNTLNTFNFGYISLLITLLKIKAHKRFFKSVLQIQCKASGLPVGARALIGIRIILKGIIGPCTPSGLGLYRIVPCFIIIKSSKSRLLGMISQQPTFKDPKFSFPQNITHITFQLQPFWFPIAATVKCKASNQPCEAINDLTSCILIKLYTSEQSSPVLHNHFKSAFLHKIQTECEC